MITSYLDRDSNLIQVGGVTADASYSVLVQSD